MQALETVRIPCPYCGESIEILVDCTQDIQEYIEDCEVCCSPIRLTIQAGGQQGVEVVARQENE
jgi:hypothetical protein